MILNIIIWIGIVILSLNQLRFVVGNIPILLGKKINGILCKNKLLIAWNIIETIITTSALIILIIKYI